MKKKINKILKNELVLYIFFGFLTTLINVGLFYLLTKVGFLYIVANIIALLTAKFVAYLSSKFFVFKKRCNNRKELFFEIITFIVFRSLTMLIDFIGLIIFVELFGVNKIIGKIILIFLVIIINYFTSKRMIFM